MTKIYFIRHAEPNYENHDDFKRELTTKGCADSKKISNYLESKDIHVIYSSPYKRTIDTVKAFSNETNKIIHEIDDLRERKISAGWISNFSAYSKNQWDDFDYKLSDGESLAETQKRNIKVINQILDEHEGENIVISTHATALCTILNHFDPNFDYKYFQKIKKVFPFAVESFFFNKELIAAKTILDFDRKIN